jgi:hypothetical protein
MFEYFGDMWALAIVGNKQGIFFFISLYSLLLLGYSAINQYKTAHWPSTEGILLNAGVKKWGFTEWKKSNQEYTASALYVYKVGEKEYQGTRMSPWVIIASHNVKFILEKQLSSIQNNEDGTITVFYNPNKPQKSYLIKPGKAGLIITSVVAVFPMLIYWLNYYG